jgi:transglutaminase-like putative cysteine protease
MKQLLAFAFLLTLTVPAGLLLAEAGSPQHHKSAPPFSPASRKFFFTYQVHVPGNKDTQSKVLVWVPLPQEDGSQKIEELRIGSPVAYTRGADPQYSNPFAFLKPTPAEVQAGFDVTVRFVATRYEHKVDLSSVALTQPVALKSRSAEVQRYLQPDNLVPLNGVIAELAKQQTAGDTTDLEKARHIYNYVLANMRYDKSGQGWGRGDAMWACSSKRGNCTDFHSLLIDMLRASGIPAGFEIGFSLPANKDEGDISG